MLLNIPQVVFIYQGCEASYHEFDVVKNVREVGQTNCLFLYISQVSFLIFIHLVIS